MDAAGAVAANNLLTRQQFALASLKHSLDSQKQASELVSQVAQGGGGAQPLNVSGPGQIVNIIA